MAFATINVGSVANDGTGDSLRTGGQAINANFLLAPELAVANTFTAIQTVTQTAAGTYGYTVTSTEAGATWAGGIRLFRNSASPAASDELSQIVFDGKDSGGGTDTYARILASISDATAASEDGQLLLATALAGTLTTQVTIANGVTVGAPTGGMQGSGTLNAVGVYDDSVLLTCAGAAREFVAEGRIDLPKWDALAPSGWHSAAHHLADMVADGFDPRDPRKYMDRLYRDEAVPGLPTQADWKHGSLSTGGWFGRVSIALECLALAFGNVLDRLEALERRALRSSDA